MIYFATPSSDSIRSAMQLGKLGMITTPAQGNIIPDGVDYCADNGCFGAGYPGDDRWVDWLSSIASARCMFAVAPDVVGDADATNARSAPWLPVIRGMGIRAAYVGQNGLAVATTPWDDFDAFFVGGCTAWKLGADARLLVSEAKRRGKWVHMGRVNSKRRLMYAASIGCDSVDGTYLTFGPDKNLPKLIGWLDAANAQQWMSI